MNRFVFGAALVVLAPGLSGCSNFYLTQGPEPLPTPTPVPVPLEFPVNPAEGTTTSATSTLGLAMNGPTVVGGPTAFRAADIRYVPRAANDPTNCIALVVLQRTYTDATGKTTFGSTEPEPVRLAGIIVPGPSVAGVPGLQDPDITAMQNEAYRRSLDAMRSWAQGQPTAVISPTATGTPIPTPTPLPTPTPSPGRRGARVQPTATPLPLVVGTNPLDVYQDPKTPFDSQTRPLVQVFFTSAGAKARPPLVKGQTKLAEPQVVIKPGTKISLNRWMIRQGFAVVDLYSSTSFDQKTWLLDEAYARHRKLGLWGLELNGKTLTLQQRPPTPVTKLGSLSRVGVTSNVPATGATPAPGATPVPGATPGGGPRTGATQAPQTLTPTLAPTSFPRVITGSGSKVQTGPSVTTVLPAPAPGSAPSTPSTSSSGSGSGGASSNSASGLR